MQLLERLQYHINKLNEGHYFWDTNETGGKLECVFDPTPNELQDFLKDYPICKAVSDGYGHWIFAYGQKICHDTLDSILEINAKKYHWSIKWPRHEDSHLSVTKNGQILGYREAGSFEASMCSIFDNMDDIDDGMTYTKADRMNDFRAISTAINSLRKKYSWFKPSTSLQEELKAIVEGKILPFNFDSKWYRW